MILEAGAMCLLAFLLQQINYYPCMLIKHSKLILQIKMNLKVLLYQNGGIKAALLHFYSDHVLSMGIHVFIRTQTYAQTHTDKSHSSPLARQPHTIS